jgi:hypothetical protein
MALKRVTYEPDEEVYRVEGGPEIRFARDDSLVMALDAVKDASVAHFQNALRRSEEHYGQYVMSIFISDTPSEDFDPDSSPRAVWLSYEKGTLAVSAGYVAGSGIRPRTADLERLIDPVLTRRRASFDGSWTDGDGASLSIGISASLDGASRSVGELHDLGVELQLLLDAVGGDFALRALTTCDLVKAGRTDVIIGEPETIWLDAKGEPYPLGSDPQKWEFAKDVAAFANTGSDALIVLGVATRKSPNGDVLNTTRPFRLASMDVAQMRATLRERLTPDIPDIDIGVVPSRKSPAYGFGWIFIPAQGRELLPFMVKGAMTGAGTWKGTHISIPVRSVEDTVYTDPAAIHSMLAAGRIALRQEPST